MIYIFWTCAHEGEAKQIIYALLDKRLIACASIFPVESIYRWEGKIQEGSEIKVLLKTLSPHFEAIRAYIQENASYEVSEIVQVSSIIENADYLNWVKNEVRS